MKFGQKTIPGSLFKLARDKALSCQQFTPDDIRKHLLEFGYADLMAISDIETNRRIVSERVMRSVVKELVASSDIQQLKRGVWTKNITSAS